MKKYYSMETVGNEANVSIYGDITSEAGEGDWLGGEVDGMSATLLSKQLAELGDNVSRINVYINSYGGEVAEGLAIYNALKRHKAEVVTYCDGFAASIASVIFMAGDVRIMNDSSLLMIHNAWSFGMGNAEQLRKQADDLDKITQASVIAYTAHSTLSEEEIKALMDNETWILPDEALEYGFATAIAVTANKAASQNAKMRLIDIIKMYRQEAAEQEAGGEEEETPENEDEESGDETKDETKPEDEPPEETSEEQPDPEDSDDEDSEDEDTKKAKNKISEFFNAILKM